MNESKWKTIVLGENGNMFYALPIAGTVLLLATFGILAFILLLNPSLPMPITIISLLCGSVFLYQAYQVLTLFIIVSKTAKQISLHDNGALLVTLFTNKVIPIDKFNITKGVPIKTSKVFPESSNATISTNDISYYISGTTNEFSDMYDRLKTIATNKT